MSEFGSEVEVEIAPCPLCGMKKQFVAASLLEVRVSCYCESCTLSVTAETEDAAYAAWRDLSKTVEVPMPMPMSIIGWNPVRHVAPPAGRMLVTVDHEGTATVTIARFDGNDWRPEGTRPIAWAPLPEAWS